MAFQNECTHRGGPARRGNPHGRCRRVPVPRGPVQRADRRGRRTRRRRSRSKTYAVQVEGDDVKVAAGTSEKLVEAALVGAPHARCAARSARCGQPVAGAGVHQRRRRKRERGNEHDVRAGRYVHVVARCRSRRTRTAAPITTDSTISRVKLSVSRRAVIGGITSVAAISVTPSTCIETTIVPARISEKIVSIQAVSDAEERRDLRVERREQEPPVEARGRTQRSRWSRRRSR